MVQVFNFKLKAEFVVFRVSRMQKYLPLGFLKQLGFVSWCITDDEDWCWASMHEIIHVHLNPLKSSSSSNTTIKEVPLVSAAKTPSSVFKTKSQNLMTDFVSPTTAITT